MAHADPVPPCAEGAANCTISTQDAGHNETVASSDNTNTTSSIAGTSSASNQSGNSIDPSFDNSAQTTQNATTTTGEISSSSTGNTSQNDNQSSATNGNQSLGQANTGTSTSTNTLGGSSSGGNRLSTGANTSSNTSTSGSSDAYAGGASVGPTSASSGGNRMSNGSASTVGPTTSMSGANDLASNSANSGGNSTTSVDASDHSRSKVIFVPPIVPPTPPSSLAMGNIIKETSACGPLQQIVRQSVSGAFIGLSKTSTVPQGWSDDLAPYRDASGEVLDYRRVREPNGDIRLYGHQVMMFTTVIGVASTRNIALGGGGGNGAWGQGGMGASSSNQRLVTNIQLRECEIGSIRTVMAGAPPMVIEVPPKKIRQ